MIQKMVLENSVYYLVNARYSFLQRTPWRDGKTILKSTPWHIVTLLKQSPMLNPFHLLIFINRSVYRTQFSQNKLQSRLLNAEMGDKVWAKECSKEWQALPKFISISSIFFKQYHYSSLQSPYYSSTSNIFLEILIGFSPPSPPPQKNSCLCLWFLEVIKITNKWCDCLWWNIKKTSLTSNPRFTIWVPNHV